MMSRAETAFHEALAEGAGTFTLCEVRADGPASTGVKEGAPGAFTLRHRGASLSDPFSRRSTNAADARFFVRYTASGEYRPLKGAPNLARDWLLELSTAAEACRALDLIYPAAFALLTAWRSGTAPSVPFSETGARQTGMYRIVGSASPDVVDSTAAAACSSAGGCLRTRLWPLEPGNFGSTLPATKRDPSIDQTVNTPGGPGHVPYLCLEACNLFVAACRSSMKKAADPAAAAAESTGQ